jgi:agmatinase
MKIFNPNEPGMANGNYFALPYTLGESEVAIVSVPWDVTTSYRSGTHKGPSSIIDASLQVDLYDPMVPDAWSVKIGSVPVDETIEKRNKKFRKVAEQVISHIEEGGELSEVDDLLAEVNLASQELNELVYKSCLDLVNAGKISGVVGGDHSVPLGNMRAVADKYEDLEFCI